MDLCSQDYLDVYRDARAYRDLKRALRQHPEDARFQFICEVIAERRGLGLRLANSCLRERKYFEALLQEALRTSDASSIRTWLKCILPRLGVVRVLGAVKKLMDADPRVVDSVLYWMPVFMSGKDRMFLSASSRREAFAFIRLREAAQEKGYIRAPVIVSSEGGKVKFGVIR